MKPMTTAVEAIPLLESTPYTPPVGMAPITEAPGLAAPEEINARRARVENPELLRRLRGL